MPYALQKGYNIWTCILINIWLPYDPIRSAVIDTISLKNFFQSAGKCLFVLICLLLTITEFFLSILCSFVFLFWITYFFLCATFCGVFFFFMFDLYILWMIIPGWLCVLWMIYIYSGWYSLLVSAVQICRVFHLQSF